MRLFGIFLALVSATGMAAAQTNAPTTNTTASIEYPPNPGEPGAMGGTNATPRRLSLQDCVEEALKHNIALQIDRYNPQIARYNLNGAYGYYDPTFSVSGQHDHNEQGRQLLGGGFFVVGSISDDNKFTSSLGGSLPWGTTYTLQGSTVNTYGTSAGGGFEDSSGSASGSITQPLLKNFLIDSTRLNIRVAKNRLKYSELTLKLQIMQTITSLEQAYNLLIYDRANVVVLQKAVELAERLVAEDRKRLEVGSLAPLDLQSAEAQAAESRAAVLAAQSQLATQERVIKLLITDRFMEWADVAIEPTGTLSSNVPNLNLQESWRKGLTQGPALLQAKLDVERVGITLKYDRNQLLPELDVFGTYGYNGSGTEFSDALYEVQRHDAPFYTYGGRLSVPLSRTTVRNTYRSDKATQQQLVLTLKQLEQQTLIAIDNDVGTIRANFDQVKATKTAREYAEAALAAEEKKLQSGKSTTYTVLQMQRDLTTASGTEIQALNNFNNSLSQLSLDEGSTLDRMNINFDVK
jgi:outer membrane protein TolC